MSHKTPVCLVYPLASLKYNLIEFGVSIVILAVFIAAIALAKDIAGQWANLVYLATLVAFTIAMCLFGLKLAPNMYDHLS
jgi:hypothetical protein